MQTKGKAGGKVAVPVNIEKLTLTEAGAHMKRLTLKENKLATDLAAVRKQIAAMKAKFPNLTPTTGAQKAAASAR